jgi:hypothetical protein
LIEWSHDDFEIAPRIDRRECTEAHIGVVAHIDVVVTTTITFVNMACPRPHNPCITFLAWPGNAFRIETIIRLCITPQGGRCMSTISGNWRLRTAASGAHRLAPPGVFHDGLPTTVARYTGSRRVVMCSTWNTGNGSAGE